MSIISLTNGALLIMTSEGTIVPATYHIEDTCNEKAKVGLGRFTKGRLKVVNTRLNPARLPELIKDAFSKAKVEPEVSWDWKNDEVWPCPIYWLPDLDGQNQTAQVVGYLWPLPTSTGFGGSTG